MSSIPQCVCSASFVTSISELVLCEIGAPPLALLRFRLASLANSMYRTSALARLPLARGSTPLHRPLSTAPRSSNARPLILLASVAVIGAAGAGLAWSPLQNESSKDHQGYDRQSQLHKGMIGELKPSVFA